MSSNETIIECFNDIQMTHIEWLWSKRIARGKLTVIAGEPGLGKSQITAYIAAVVSNGNTWPDSIEAAPKSKVLFLCAEDDAADTIKPRLVAAGANIENCYILRAVREQKQDKPDMLRPFNLAQDIERLSKIVKEIGNVGLIVIDPISAYVGATDSNNNSAIRALLMPLTDLAEEENFSVIAITHLNKSKDQDLIGRVIGSIGLIATARTGYAVVKDEKNPDLRYFFPMKSNIGNDKDGFSFFIEETHVGQEHVETSRVVFSQDLIPIQQIISLYTGENDSRYPDAKVFLEEILTGGELSTVELFEQAKANGFSKGMVRRAKEKLGIKPRKEGKDGGWYWGLPKKILPIPYVRPYVEDIEDDEEEVPV